MLKTKNIKKNIPFFLVFALFGFIPSITKAANMYFSPIGQHSAGELFSVDVFVSSSDQAMNAVSGKVSFSKDTLQAVSLSEKGSVITLWIKNPYFSSKTGTINFEGIVPNPGFLGNSGKVLSINFKILKSGPVDINFSSGRVLANDGLGTNILTDLNKIRLGLNVLKAVHS